MVYTESRAIKEHRNRSREKLLFAFSVRVQDIRKVGVFGAYHRGGGITYGGVFAVSTRPASPQVSGCCEGNSFHRFVICGL